MSQAIHIGPNLVRDTEWFECPRCGVRMEVAQRVWAEVEVVGPKLTLNACEHRPHIPPSPAALRAHSDDLAMLDLLAAIGGAA